MMESAVALAMLGNVWRSFIANRKRRGAPHFTSIVVTDVDGFSGGIADGIVGPRRQLIFAAVERPRVARARFRNKEAKRSIRDHVDPGRRSSQTFTKYGYILVALIG